MIPTWPATFGAYAFACAFFTFLGLPLARRVALPLAAAPALGWAAYTVLALPVLSIAGFGTLAVTLYAAAWIAAAGWAWWRRAGGDAHRLPVWAVGIALAMGCLALMAIMPKTVANGILLAPPMFDHVKIALVDGILRDGLPVPNPFYGPETPGHLAYYYLWHFGAAGFGRLLHVGGWQAEAAMTGFTAFSSVMLMMGLAAALGGRAIAIAGAAVLSLPGSLRPLLEDAFGGGRAGALIPPSSDLGNWLNQSAWVPQHMASATCVVLSALLMLRLADGAWDIAVLLGLTAAAGFESSTWVGGIAFAGAGLALGIWLLWQSPRRARLRLLAGGLGSCCVLAVLIAPFVLAEWHGLAARQGGAGAGAAPYPVFGAAVPAAWRSVLDVPGFWLVLLPFAFPAVMPLGLAALWMGRPAAPPRLVAGLSITATGCLCVAWLLRSTLDNNDLGWRAVLPALLILAPLAAVGGEQLVRHRPRAVVAFGVLVALGLPQTAIFLGDYAFGQRPGDPAAFAQSGPVWEATRRVAGRDERIANDPLYVQAATPWPVNISWALLSGRPSCYAGWESVLAYGGISRAALEALNARFTRVFAGTPQPGDIRDLAAQDNCSVAVVVPADGAWVHDPFAGSGIYRLAEQAAGWRIYRRAALSQTDPAGADATFAPAPALSDPAPRRDRPSPPGR